MPIVENKVEAPEISEREGLAFKWENMYGNLMGFAGYILKGFQINALESA